MRCVATRAPFSSCRTTSISCDTWPTSSGSSRPPAWRVLTPSTPPRLTLPSSRSRRSTNSFCIDSRVCFGLLSA
ncbi:MAG: hypothetical protein MHM6MM_007504, partial [Cercozoa sp. M6MM]